MSDSKKSGYSRRDFLKGSALTGAGLGLAGFLAACSAAPAPQAASGADTSAAGITWDKETDVVVVGFGGAGGAAAIEAAKAGAAVTILEISDTGGGSTAMNGGFLYMGGTKLQEELGVEDDTEQVFQYLKAGGGGSANEEALRVMADSCPDLYEWCLEVGMTFDKVLDMHHSGAGFPGVGLTFSGNEHSRAISAVSKPAPRGHVPSPEGSGMGFFRPIKAKAEELGCEILYGTTGESLFTDEGGRVIGIAATGADGTTQNIKANRAVVLTAGGFTMNEAMLVENWIYPSRAGFGVANPNELGIGINMGIAVGAATYGMSNHQIGASTYGAHPDLPKGLIVNQAGRRIIAEDAYGSYAGEKIMQNDGAYLLVDDAVQQLLAAEGAYEPLASAATVEELASGFGIPGSTLVDTLSYYNSSIAGGEDPELGKTAEYLVPLTTPPYHLHYFGPQATYFMTSGGLKINLKAQVVDRNDAVIPGLYSAGRNGSISFGHYMASGSSMLDCLVFGRLAGQGAAAETPAA